MNWRAISGYEGLYAVSDKGAVRNDRTLKVLKPDMDKDGYMSVVLSKDNKPRGFRLHRLVAAAFVRLPTDGEQVNHKNGKRSDNKASNLEWLTNTENQRHSYSELGREYRIPQCPVFAKGDGFLLCFDSQAALARFVKLHPVKVYNALKGRGRVAGLEIYRG